MLSRLSELIWADWLWFPRGHSWADLNDADGKVYPKPSDLWATVPIAVCFLVIRQVFERTVATPLASLLGVRESKRVRAPSNPVLEAHFRSSSKDPAQGSVVSLSKQTDWSVQQVQRWFKQRRNQDRPSKLKKFQEASWRFTFYLLAFFAGLAVLVD
ncbi:LOW QUALITY PROTEIN: ceramide synthase 2-like, partial [Brachionichthys hirsutus]|uniref:LOW QUALITY PROTEIN: ceramide synthase 2-like n=1 Tax=Brachionichthys hirsutus TaxID=412623 RepID=UPI003604D0B2